MLALIIIDEATASKNFTTKRAWLTAWNSSSTATIARGHVIVSEVAKDNVLISCRTSYLLLLLDSRLKLLVRCRT